MTEIEIERFFGQHSKVQSALDALLDARKIDTYGKVMSGTVRKRLATFYRLTTAMATSEHDATDVSSLEPAEYSAAESGEGPALIRLPAWFRIDRTILQSIEDLIEWPEHENVRLKQEVSPAKKDWMSHALCAGVGESTRLDSLCKRAGEAPLWDYITQRELNNCSDNVAVVLFVLYEMRSAVYIRAQEYLREQFTHLGRDEWFYLVALFLDRFRLWKEYTSISTAEYYLDDLFGLTLREGISLDDISTYIKTTVNALKWTSIARGRFNNFLSRMAGESIDEQARIGQRKISSARRRKSLRNKFLTSIRRSDLHLFFSIPHRL